MWRLDRRWSGASFCGRRQARDVCLLPQMHMEEPCFDFLRTKETLGSVAVVSSECTDHVHAHPSNPQTSRSTGTRCTPPAETPRGCWASPSPWKRRRPSSGELPFLHGPEVNKDSTDGASQHASGSFTASAWPLCEIPPLPPSRPACPGSTELVEAKIEEFLVSFGERLSGLSEEAFGTQVTALIKLKECEDAHLGEEVDRNWFEVVTQQYVFKRLNKEVSSLPPSLKEGERRRRSRPMRNVEFSQCYCIQKEFLKC